MPHTVAGTVREVGRPWWSDVPSPPHRAAATMRAVPAWTDTPPVSRTLQTDTPPVSVRHFSCVVASPLTWENDITLLILLSAHRHRAERRLMNYATRPVVARHG